jgi:hypothetical protein
MAEEHGSVVPEPMVPPQAPSAGELVATFVAALHCRVRFEDVPDTVNVFVVIGAPRLVK